MDPRAFGKDFWAEIRERAIEIARPLFTDLFLLGAELGRSITPAKAGRKELLPVDPALINRQLDLVLDEYMDDWWRGLQKTTDEGLRAAIRRASAAGTGVEGVMKDIAPLFSPGRLQRIAATESTRLLGLGAQATYAASGLEEWEWQTVRDARVDPICRELQGKRFPMETAFGPAHVSCRCYPKPVVPEGGAPARPTAGPGGQVRPGAEAKTAPWPKAGFKSRKQVETFLRKTFPETDFDFELMPTKVANAMGQEFHRLATAFPAVQKRLLYVGMNRNVRGKALPYVKEIVDRRKTYAHATVDGKSISLNPHFFSQPSDVLGRRIAWDQTTGWHPAMPDPTDYTSILTHEYGHQIQFWLEASTSQVTSAARVSGVGLVRDTFNMWADTHRPIHVSIYGDENFREGWAEAFVVAQKGKTPTNVGAREFVRAQKTLLAALDESKWRNAGKPVFTSDIRQDAEALRRANEENHRLSELLDLKE